MDIDPVLQDIYQREDIRLRAVANNDTEQLQKLLDPELHYVHASGVIEDKAGFIRRLASGERRYQRFESLTREARRLGDTTLLFGQCDIEVASPAGARRMVINYTAVYFGTTEPRLLAWHSTLAA